MGDGDNSFDQQNQRLEGQQVNIGSLHGDIGQIGDVVYGDKTYARSQEEELRAYLAKAVSDYEARILRAVYQSPQQPDEPYKSLYAFEVEDANIFFGRDAAATALYETILKDRLTVMYARSGAGKSSLLNAGLTPQLIQEGRLPVFARTYHDPVYALKQAIAPQSGGPWPALLPTLSLQAFLGLVCSFLSNNNQELIVILDQFEEFFIFWPESERADFVSLLADCYEDSQLPVRFIIALRKDYFADMDAFEKRIPSIFSKQFGLKAMSRAEAKLAITGPIGRLNQDIKYEHRLLDALLEDLASGEIELPHLQLVCRHLFASLPAARNEILLDDYEAFGRTAGVLGNYLKKTIDELPGQQTEVAKNVLKALVSSGLTKRVMNYNDLAASIAESEVILQTVLARLINARVLRRDEAAGEIVYEMAHEVLIDEIRTWFFNEDELRYKEAEELLAREVANWRTYRTPIPKDRLELLYAHRDGLGAVSSEAAACLLGSAVLVEYQVEEWTTLTSNIGEPQLHDILTSASGPGLLALFRGLSLSWQFPQLAALGDVESQKRLLAASALGVSGDARAVELLIAAFKDEVWNVRWAAVGALAKLGEPAFDPLIAALTDKSWNVRQGAASALGELGDQQAVEPLIVTLKDEVGDVRQAAVDALAKLGEPAFEPLIAALKDEDEVVRRHAAWALGLLGDERAVEPLIAVLKDEDGNLLQGAAWALGRLGDEQAVEPLITALKDDDETERARVEAALALKQLGAPAIEPLITILKEEDADTRQAAAETLGKMGEPAVEPLIAVFKDEDVDIRQATAETLGKMGDPAFESLITCLKDKDERVRHGAAWALGLLGDERAVEPLIAVLKDKHVYARNGATWALGQLGEPAVEPLISALRESSFRVRYGAARALAELGDERAVEPLISALKDEDADVRKAASWALGQSGKPAFEPLIAALLDEDDVVRGHAAWALGLLGDERAVEPLVTAIRDDDETERVRQEAALALGELGDERAVEPLVSALSYTGLPTRLGAALALGELGDGRAVEPLITALGDKSRYLRQVAAEALGQLGDERAVEPLVALRRDEHEDVRQNADEALIKLGWQDK